MGESANMTRIKCSFMEEWQEVLFVGNTGREGVRENAALVRWTTNNVLFGHPAKSMQGTWHRKWPLRSHDHCETLWLWDGFRHQWLVGVDGKMDGVKYLVNLEESPLEAEKSRGSCRTTTVSKQPEIQRKRLKYVHVRTKQFKVQSWNPTADQWKDLESDAWLCVALLHETPINHIKVCGSEVNKCGRI